MPKEYIERGQIYFGFEVDEKLLSFTIEEFGDESRLTDRISRLKTASTAWSLSSSNETIGARKASRRLEIADKLSDY